MNDTEDTHTRCCTEWDNVQKIDDLRRELKETQAALVRHGKHDPECDEFVCKCGFAAWSHLQ